MEIANPFSRYFAYVIDCIVLGVAGMIATLTLNIFSNERQTTNPLTCGIMILAFYCYFAVSWVVSNGQTIGMKVMSIRVVSIDGSHLTLGKALVRGIGYFVNFIFLDLGWIWILIDERKQGWHDKIAGTYVVTVPH